MWPMWNTANTANMADVADMGDRASGAKTVGNLTPGGLPLAGCITSLWFWPSKPVDKTGYRANVIS